MVRPKHVLVTGAGGFVGYHLCSSLQANGLRVTRLYRHSPMGDDRFSFDSCAVDLEDESSTKDLLYKLQPDCVVHLAASKFGRSDILSIRSYLDTDVPCALNLIEACQSIKNFKRFVFMGSCDEYGPSYSSYMESLQPRPASAYGLAKLAITQLLIGLYLSSDFPAVVLRPSVVYGPAQTGNMFIPALIRALAEGQDFPMTGGEQTRDFLYIGDLVETVIRVIFAGNEIDGKVINVGAGKSVDLKTVVNMVSRQVPGADVSRVRLGALDYRANESMNYSVCIDLASKLLGWLPKTDMEKGLKLTVDYFLR